MEDEVGIPMKDRQEILIKIFGKDGLAESQDVDVFQLRLEPAKKGKVNTHWTNNNSESANHILKSATSWKARDMPRFIEILYEIAKGEEMERSRAMRDTGNFKLDPAFQHHYTDIDHWTDISQDQRDKRMKKFKTDKGKTNPNIISSDGTRSIMKTPSAGKKKNQLKRKRSQRSRTPNAKRALLDN